MMTPRSIIASLLILSAISAAEASIPIEVLVEVSEIDDSKASRLGVEWFSKAQFAEEGGSVVGVGSIRRLSALQADLHFLIEEGAAEMLASPNLVTDSGTPASFHAGGQLPYVTSTSLGATNV